MQKNFLCFHTCKNENSEEYILQNAPFHSNPAVPQWLGQGYYLWTDSDHYAHLWGSYSPRNNKYVILKFDFILDNSDEMLDLVGNVDDQLVFKNLIDEYQISLQKAISESKQVEKRKAARSQLSKLCVSTVINFYRKKKCFPYKAVKAQDIDSNDSESLQFVVEGKGSNPLFFYPTRQQIVVYPEGKAHLINKEIYHVQ